MTIYYKWRVIKTYNTSSYCVIEVWKHWVRKAKKIRIRFFPECTHDPKFDSFRGKV